MAVILKVTFNGKTSLLEVTKKPIIIGRSTEVSYTVHDSECSSVHCEVKLVNNVTVIKDLNSKNGTYVNGTLQKETAIHIGDEIKIGKTKLCLESANMSEDELSIHTLNVDRKQTQMLSLNDLGLKKNTVNEKAKIISPKQLKEREEEKDSGTWWKKIFKK